MRKNEKERFIDRFEDYEQRVYDPGQDIFVGHGTALRDWDSYESDDYTDGVTIRTDDYSDGW
jgi:hypothetical protein